MANPSRIQRRTLERNLDRLVIWRPDINVGRDNQGATVRYQPDVNVWVKRINAEELFSLAGDPTKNVILSAYQLAYLTRYILKKFTIPQALRDRVGPTAPTEVTVGWEPTDIVIDGHIGVRAATVEELSRLRWLLITTEGIS